MDADYILKSTAIFTSADDKPTAGGVVVAGSKISGVFRESQLEAYVGPKTKVIDYGQRLIMPGFIDSHTHTSVAMDFVDESYCIDISSVHTFPDIMKLMREYGNRHPDNPVVFGINFNLFNLEEYFMPTARAMDEYFPDRPALLMTWDCHTWFANTRAIQMAGITKDSPDPNRGMGKDENGELTGRFDDTGSFEIQKIIDRSFEARKGSLINFMNKLNACGITSIADVFPFSASEPYPLYKAMEKSLTTRIHFYPPLLDFTPESVDLLKREYSSPTLQFSGLKCLLDGVLTVYTAWMLEPYANKPETCGSPTVPKEEVRAKVLEACRLGVNVRIHTIGDAAVRYALNVFEEAEKAYGKLERRHCMEHIEYINPADISRFAQLGVVADMHPRHLTFYIDEAIRYLGTEREKYTWVFRDIINTGAIIGTGSDFPVVHFNPMLGIYAAVTRALDNGYPEGGWHPEQKLTLAEILKIYTIGSACAINRDKELGTLEPGKLADITVLDRNLFDIDVSEILNVKSVMTMMDGRIVYDSV